MSLNSETSKIKAEEPDNVTSSIAHKDSSAEPGDLTRSTTHKDSSSDNKSTTSVESGDAVDPSPSGIQTVNVPTTTVPVYRRPLQPATAATAFTSNNSDTRHLIIPNRTLRYTTMDDALADGLMGREPMTINDDDVLVVKDETNSQAWVTQLIEAYTTDYLSTPEDPTKKTLAQHEWFARWQKQAHATLVTIVNSKDPEHVEKACWNLLKTVIEAHELGVVDAGGNMPPLKLKCSERLAYIVSTLKKYALVRLDVLRAWHVNEIAANPEAFIKRKLVNCWNNGHRAEKAKGTKRAARDVDEQGEDQTPVKVKKARKSLAGDVKDGEAKDDGKAGAQSLRSVITPDSDDKDFTLPQRPAALETSSGDNVEVNAGEAVDDGEQD